MVSRAIPSPRFSVYRVFIHLQRDLVHTLSGQTWAILGRFYAKKFEVTSLISSHCGHVTLPTDYGRAVGLLNIDLLLIYET